MHNDALDRLEAVTRSLLEQQALRSKATVECERARALLAELVDAWLQVAGWGVTPTPEVSAARVFLEETQK